jgi:hypothetical protein
MGSIYYDFLNAIGRIVADSKIKNTIIINSAKLMFIRIFQLHANHGSELTPDLLSSIKNEIKRSAGLKDADIEWPQFQNQPAQPPSSSPPLPSSSFAPNSAEMVSIPTHELSVQPTNANSADPQTNSSSSQVNRIEATPVSVSHSGKRPRSLFSSSSSDHSSPRNLADSTPLPETTFSIDDIYEAPNAQKRHKSSSSSNFLPDDFIDFHITDFRALETDQIIKKLSNKINEILLEGNDDLLKLTEDKIILFLGKFRDAMTNEYVEYKNKKLSPTISKKNTKTLEKSIILIYNALITVNLKEKRSLSDQEIKTIVNNARLFIFRNVSDFGKLKHNPDVLKDKILEVINKITDNLDYAELNGLEPISEASSS